MSRKKADMDQLTIDSTNAIKEGMSYGKYMATKKPTIPTITTTQSHDFSGYKHTCQFCRKEFVVYDRKVRKFCSDRCRERSYSFRKISYPKPKICPICGKEFMAETYRNKYCGEFCARVAQGQKVRQYMARKAEEAKCNG